MVLHILLLVFFVVFAVQTHSQTAPAEAKSSVRARVDENGIPLVSINKVVVEGKMPSHKQRQEYLRKVRNFEKLRYNLRIVYPMAKDCGKILKSIDAEKQKIKNPGEEKKYLERMEKELFAIYEPKIQQLTLTQGKLLLKLIHREAGSNAYSLIEEYKSWRSAAFWQLIARFFGANLKEEYNKAEEEVIEYLIYEIETGKEFDFNVK